MSIKQKFLSKYTLVLVLVLLFGVILSQTIRYPEYSNVKEFKILGVENGTVLASALIEVANPNWFSYSGRDLHCEMYYKDRLIAIGESDENFRFRKKSTSTIQMSTSFFMDSLKDELRTFLFKDSIEIELRISGRFSFLRIPVKKSMRSKICLSDLTKALFTSMMGKEGFKLTKMQLKELSPLSSSFDVGFKFTNRTNMELTLEKVDFSIYADSQDNKSVSDWSFVVNEVIQSGNSKQIEGQVKVDNVKSAISGIIKVFSGSLTYYMNGNASVKIDNRLLLIPINQSFEIDLKTREIIIK